MKFFKWLRGKETEELPEQVAIDTAPTKSTILEGMMREIENTTLEEKRFIDEETGKSYKTERGLKGAITRRLNKAKKTEESKNVKKS